MVVGAVVDVLAAVGGQSACHVDGRGPALKIHLVNEGKLVRCGRTSGQAVCPDGRGGGDDAQVHRDRHIACQRVHKAEAGQKPLLGGNARLSGGILPGGGIHPVQEGVLLTEIDPVVLPLAGQTLTPGFGGHPEVPAGDMVGHIVLGLFHKGAVCDCFHAEFGRLLEIAVLQLGHLLVRQESADHQHPAKEGAEQGSDKLVVLV